MPLSTLPDPAAIMYPSIPERPVSFSPPPTAPPKAYNAQRRKSTSILEAHTRHFQPTYTRYGSSLHPFSGLEAVEAPPLYMMTPGFAPAPQRLGVGEPLHFPGQPDAVYGYKDVRAERCETVRRLSLNQAALLDHYEAMAYGGYPMAPHPLGHLAFHQQRQAAAAAASLAFEPVPPPPQPAFLHPHLIQRMSAHSPVPPTLAPMSAPPIAPVPSSSSDGCYPPAQHAPSPAYSISAPPVLAEGLPPTGSVFEFHLAAAAAAAAAAAGDPALLASRLYRGRRSSMDLPLEDNAGSASGGSGTYSRLQPVTEEFYAYISPELPLPPGSLLLHHAALAAKDRSPEPSSDSLASSDAGEFQSPPPPPLLHPSYDSSAAQSIPQSSSATFYDSSGGAFPFEPHGHPPSMLSFLPPTPSSELPLVGAATSSSSSSQLETLIHSAWARHGGVVPAQPDMTYHESLLAMQAANPTLVLSLKSPFDLWVSY